MRIDPVRAYGVMPPAENQNRTQSQSGVPESQGRPIGPALPSSPEDTVEALKNAYGEKQLKKVGIIECETCANRTYVDGSDDPGVSFKTPGKIDPDAAASVVMSHEMEHVSNEQADAKAENREVVSQSVTLSTAICPECGRVYVSGGNTRTVTKGEVESPYDISKELLKGAKYDQNV